MPLCPNCTTVYLDRTCRFCDARREELLERLQVEDGVATFAEVAAMALIGSEAVDYERRWRVG